MSLKRWNARRDASEKPIVAALRQVGAKVMHLDKFDLLVLYKGQLYMLDAKKRKGRVTDSQHELIADGWPLKFVEDADQAFAWLGVWTR